jgi:hypothetical protein
MVPVAVALGVPVIVALAVIVCVDVTVTVVVIVAVPVSTWFRLDPVPALILFVLGAVHAANNAKPVNTNNSVSTFINAGTLAAVLSVMLDSCLMNDSFFSPSTSAIARLLSE